MKKILVLAACLALLTAGAAQAANSLYIGNNYSTPIYMSGFSDGTHVEGGGSIETSTLNGNTLGYLYCVDLLTTVNVPGTYDQTAVNTNGVIYGNPLNNVSTVAWILSEYGVAGQGGQAQGVQASIWNVVTGGAYTLDPTYYDGSSTTNALYWYNQIMGKLSDPTVDEAAIGASRIGNFYWITPGVLDTAGNTAMYQGLAAPTPIPGTLMLLGSGLTGLVGIARFRRKRSAN